MGLSFSVRSPTPAPPSLKNIYIALKKDYPTFKPPPNNGGLLVPWADCGVLMLNACLTVRASEANSHSNKGWEKLTQRAIDVVAQRRVGGVVFMAWGIPAAKRVLKVDKRKHLVLNSVHPSPLSASRGFVSESPLIFDLLLYWRKVMLNFRNIQFDCGHFRKANEWLVMRYGEGGEINWNLDGSKIPKQNNKPVEEVDAGFGDEFDPDEEEAMIQAAIEIEKQEGNTK